MAIRTKIWTKIPWFQGYINASVSTRCNVLTTPAWREECWRCSFKGIEVTFSHFPLISPICSTAEELKSISIHPDWPRSPSSVPRLTHLSLSSQGLKREPIPQALSLSLSLSLSLPYDSLCLSSLFTAWNLNSNSAPKLSQCYKNPSHATPFDPHLLWNPSAALISLRPKKLRLEINILYRRNDGRSI